MHREQTDEWKGWLQLIILVYYGVGAEKVSRLRIIISNFLKPVTLTFLDFMDLYDNSLFNIVVFVFTRLWSLFVFLGYRRFQFEKIFFGSIFGLN